MIYEQGVPYSIPMGIKAPLASGKWQVESWCRRPSPTFLVKFFQKQGSTNSNCVSFRFQRDKHFFIKTNFLFLPYRKLNLGIYGVFLIYKLKKTIGRLAKRTWNFAFLWNAIPPPFLHWINVLIEMIWWIKQVPAYDFFKHDKWHFCLFCSSWIFHN